MADASAELATAVTGSEMACSAGLASTCTILRTPQGGAQLCLALQYVHARGILHRDVKPANVLLADDGSCRLADFGVSRRLASTAALATTCVGTPSFMAPELHADQPYASAADVWALGCVLHECLTLKPAFAAPSAAALGILIRRGTRASALPADTPAPLRRLIDSMLTHDASRRRVPSCHLWRP